MIGEGFSGTIYFTYDVEKKNFIKVHMGGQDTPPTLIKVDETSNEAILKVCQAWLDAFGLVNTEYRVNVQLH